MSRLGIAAACAVFLAAWTQTAPATAAKAFVAVKGSCGDQSDNQFCVRVGASQTDQVTVSHFSQRFAAPGVAIVTWQGTVSCSVNAQPIAVTDAAGGGAEYYLHLALQDDNAPLKQHKPGAVTVGERRNMDFIASGARAYRSDMVYQAPVVLTRTFDIRKKGDVRFRTVAKGDFRRFKPADSITSESGCVVNGGSIMIDFRPD